jgi:non-specific serine/threonine protein kinase
MLPEARHSALATPLTSIVGRDTEIAAVIELLRSADGRLITLTGPGGVGKTRVANRVAELATWFEDGVVAVSLAHIGSSDRLILAILQETGARDGANQPPILQLAGHIGHRHLLLVLDNFEQIIDAAPQLIRLLQHCPRLRILTTSRIALNVSAERLQRVAPFPVPPAGNPRMLDELAASDAIRLFIERAQAVRPGFALRRDNAAAIRAICERADGLPLAIELAAARIDSLTPERLLEEMDASLALLTGGPRDVPVRLRSLTNAIAWSHNLLSPAHATLFRSISVFFGSFSLDDAARIATDNPGPVPIDVLDGITSLVQSSLLLRADLGDTEPRFRLLTTIREYAREQLALDPAAEEQVCDRHAGWCLSLERDPRDGTRDRVTGQWLDTIESHYDDISSALEWLTGKGAVSAAMDLATTMAPFWGSRGRRTEGRFWLELVAAYREADRPRLRSVALQWAAVLAALQGDDENALRLVDALLASLPHLADRAAAGDALRAVSFVAEFAGQSGQSLAYAQRAVREFASLPDHPLRPWAVLRLAVASFMMAEYDEAETFLSEALSAFRRTGSQQGNFFALILRGQIAQAQGRVPEAAGSFLQALGVHQQLQEAWGTADFFVDIAGLAAARGDALEAAAFLGAAGRSFERSRTAPRPCSRPVYDRAVASTRSLLGADLFERSVADGRRMGLDESFDLAGDYLRAIVDGAGADVPVSGISSLSEREIEVLVLIAHGRTDREIASQLHVSRRTASTHVAHILKKLSANSRAEAAALAVRLRIV